MPAYGTLYLIPAVIAENTASSVLPSHNTTIIQELDEFIVENDRTARRFLKSIGYSKSLDSVILHTLNKHTERDNIPDFIQALLKGKNVGLLSEAGCPCIADPGSVVVALAHDYHIPIKPLVGPSSIFLALMASGFNGQNFAFNGYLPIEQKERIRKLRELENKALREDQTQIFMETPYRNLQIFQCIVSHCKPSSHLCIAANITDADEFIQTKTIAEWKNISPQIHKKTAIFLLYK